MALYRIEIPSWRPALANELVGYHHRTIAGRKRRDFEQVHRACLAFGVPKAEGKRRVEIVIAGRYSTFPDPDAPLKSTLDALKRAGAIVDDSAELCTWEVPRFERGPKGTVIILEDI